MAEIPLSVDTSQAVDPLRKLADQLESIEASNDDLQKSFKDTFSKSEQAIDGATHALRDNTKAVQSTDKAVDDLKKEAVEFQKTSRKSFDDKPVDEYTKSVKDADKSVDALDKETKDLGKSSTSVFGGMKDGLGEIGESAAGLNFGGVQGGFSNILKGLGPIGIGVAAVGAGLGIVANEVFQVDKHFDELRGTVQLLFKGTEEETDRIVVNVEAIAKTFGIEAKDAITAANTVAKEFGKTGEEATKLIADGLNSAANINGNFLEDLKEFAPQIRAAGGDVEDLVEILKISGEEGIFSNKGIDAVKEAGIKLREQADGTKEALTNAFGADFSKEIFDGINSGALSSVDAVAQISERMGGLRENSKATQELISGVFGGAGEDAGFRFLTLLKDINDETNAGNEALTEEQQRKQETFEANQRLAAAQNKLSKAIGDSSAIGRIWIDVQTFFVELLVEIVDGINDVAEAFESWEDFGMFLLELVVPGLEAYNENLDGLNAAQRDHVFVVSQATEAIRKYGQEAKVRIGVMQDEFDVLESSTALDSEKEAVIKRLNEEYPELVGNINLERASTEELNAIKEKITRTILEEEIARKKLTAQRLLDIEIDRVEAELARTARGSARAEELQLELEFLKTRVQQRIDNVEEETRIQLGLTERKNEELVEEEELTQDELNKIAQAGADERQKIADEFNKAIQEIIKRGQSAFLNDQIVSEEERLERQRDFQLAELAGLIEHAKDLNEQLTGSRQLDLEVIEAYNRAQEAIEVDFQNKILAIQRAAAEKRRAEQLKLDQDILKEKEADHATQLALIEARQREELALIEQTTTLTGRRAAEFERNKQIETLDIQAFYLSQKIALSYNELALKKEALGQELEAIEDKEGAEYTLKRENVDRKVALLEQETAAIQAESNAQLNNIETQIAALENIEGPTLGDVFGEVQSALAEAFNLDPQQLQAISQAFQQVASQIFNTIQQSLADQLAANDEIIAQLQEREDEVKDSLEREIEFARDGYAANVAAKQKELNDIQAAEEQAAERRKEILEEQQKLDTISQAVSLITASANLYKSLSSLPFGIGIAVATLLSAAMLAAFVSTKAKARSVASLEKGGYGDDTGVITGKRHYQGGERLLDHVEVEQGEGFSIYRRRANRKHRELIRGFTEAVNNDRISEFMLKHDVPEKIATKQQQIKHHQVVFQTELIADNLNENLAYLPGISKAIEKQFKKPKMITHNDKDGNMYIIEIAPSGGRKITKLKS